MELKPPLGIAPRYVHDAHRMEDLKNAISRYLSDGRRIDPEWVDEYNELCQKYTDPYQKIREEFSK